MVIVSDTTPIISLMRINKLDLLEKLFGEVIVPSAVFNELTQNNKFSEEAKMVKDCTFIQLMDVKNKTAVKILETQMGLDIGESEAIVLAEDLNADILIVDERKARIIAKNMGRNVTGTLGLLIECKRRGYIENLKDCMDGLVNSGIRIGEQLYNDILELEKQ